jgi:hypothetical protein
MPLDPVLQARIRQIMSTRGGPLAEGDTTLIPVAVIAGYPLTRQPQLEAGEGLVRSWVASHTVNPAAGERAHIFVRPATTNTLLWVYRLAISIDPAETGRHSFRFGRQAAAVIADSVGVVGWEDMRLGETVDPPVTIAGDSIAGSTSPEARGLITCQTGTNGIIVPCSFVIQGDPNAGTAIPSVIVECRSLDIAFEVTFWGEAHEIIR